MRERSFLDVSGQRGRHGSLGFRSRVRLIAGEDQEAGRRTQPLQLLADDLLGRGIDGETDHLFPQCDLNA